MDVFRIFAVALGLGVAWVGAPSGSADAVGPAFTVSGPATRECGALRGCDRLCC